MNTSRARDPWIAASPPITAVNDGGKRTRRRDAAKEDAQRKKNPFQTNYLRGPSSRLRAFAFSSVTSRAAFTLLEVILALGIMSVVAVALFTSLHVAFKSKRTAEAVLEPVRAGEQVMEMIRADLELALPPRGVLAGAFKGRDWRGGGGGDDDDVSFFTAADAPPGALRFGDIKRVELTVVTLTRTGERALARRVTGNLLSPVPIDPDDEILCRGVVSFNIRYYDGTSWWSTWDSTLEEDTLPVAVEVTLELEPTGTRANVPAAVAGRTPDPREAIQTPRGPRLMRVVHIPCTGKGDPSDEEEVSPEGTDSAEGASQARALGRASAGSGGYQ